MLNVNLKSIYLNFKFKSNIYEKFNFMYKILLIHLVSFITSSVETRTDYTSLYSYSAK